MKMVILILQVPMMNMENKQEFGKLIMKMEKLKNLFLIKMEKEKVQEKNMMKQVK